MRHRDAPSTPHRGRLAAFALIAALATPATAQASCAQPQAAPGSPASQAASLEFSTFDDQAFIQARKSGAPVGLYFEADWCAPCKEMHSRTFSEPAVVEAAAGIRFFRVDLTSPSRQADLLQKSFRVIGAPTVILFGPDGKESDRRFGFIPPDDFARMLGKSRKPPEST